VKTRTAHQSTSPHWLLFFGLAMTTTFLLIWVSQSVLTWTNTLMDDWHYGRPRTAHYYAFVGHETGQTPTHLIALNQGGQVQIIEIPGGDTTQTKTYLGPQLTGEGADLLPVEVAFVDKNGDKKVDMVIRCGAAVVWLKNQQGRFVTP
jgi:hypothetical protein